MYEKHTIIIIQTEYIFPTNKQKHHQETFNKQNDFESNCYLEVCSTIL